MFDYLAGRPYAPRGALWDAAVADWRQLGTDADATFDREISIDLDDLAPQITWGNSPEAVLPVDGRIPDPAHEHDSQRRAAMEAALAYMDLTPGAAIAGTPIDWVFIGSCTNGRLSDLRAAAAVIERTQGGAERAGVGGAGVARREKSRGSRRARHDFPQRRIRMARAGLLDVPWRQWRHRAKRETQRVDVEPQLHRPPGARQPHPSCQPRGRGGVGLRRRPSPTRAKCNHRKSASHGAFDKTGRARGADADGQHQYRHDRADVHAGHRRSAAGICAVTG